MGRFWTQFGTNLLTSGGRRREPPPTVNNHRLSWIRLGWTTVGLGWNWWRSWQSEIHQIVAEFKPKPPNLYWIWAKTTILFYTLNGSFKGLSVRSCGLVFGGDLLPDSPELIVKAWDPQPDWAGSRSRDSSQTVPFGCRLGLENPTLKKCLVLISPIHSYYTQKVDTDHIPLSCITVLLPSCRPIHHATTVYLMWKNGPFLSKENPIIKYQNSNSRCLHFACCY